MSKKSHKERLARRKAVVKHNVKILEDTVKMLQDLSIRKYGKELPFLEAIPLAWKCIEEETARRK